MKRSYILDLLTKYQPIEEIELAYKSQMQKFIATHDDCFERHLHVGHITASAWLINKPGSHALLMHHRKLKQWFQLGGHCDGDSNILKVAIKEAQEESGIVSISPVCEEIFDIDVHLIPANNRERKHYHYDVRFLLQVTSDEQIKQNLESNELRWIGKNEHDLPTNSPSVVRMFNKWILRFLPTTTVVEK